MIDDLKGIDKVRLAIHLLEQSYFFTKYDEDFIRLLKEVLEILDSNSKKVITNFAKYTNLLYHAATKFSTSISRKVTQNSEVKTGYVFFTERYTFL